MANSVGLEIEQVSEDLYDYARDNYDYIQIELLNENFKPAPPISVAEYKARTSKILPQGIFDENKVPGVFHSSKEKRYQEGNMEVDSSQPVRIKELCGVYEVGNSHMKEDKGQQIASNQANNQKKKKKKFKKFEFSNTEPSTVYNVPFVPDFSNNCKMYPPL